MFLSSVPGINGCVNNREAGDFRRHHAHYDATVMKPERYVNVLVLLKA